MLEGAAPQGADAVGLCLTRQFLPLDDCVLTADGSAENRAWLKAHLGPRPLRTVPRSQLLEQIRARHGAALRDQAVFGLARRFPELSAQTVVTRTQSVAACILAAVALAGFALSPVMVARVGIALLTLAFSASGVFRVVLTLLAREPRPIAIGNQAALPSYTILVPLYREAEVLAELIAALAALDYPGIMAQTPQEI